ncbi:MAG: hypothetical protein HQL51_07585 [Magnetococcales bacterium]|nr:hypothetical protein [Magnetococcales bacterium]
MILPPPSSLPRLVGHRGEPRRAPENTLASLRSALEAGAEWVEFDLQMTADRVPVLLHDKSLHRTANVRRTPWELTLAQMQRLDAGYRRQFGDQFAGERIPTLAEAVALLESHPGVGAMVEIKSESLRHFGAPILMDRVLAELAPLQGRCVLIATRMRALRRARHGGFPVGLIFFEWTPVVRRRAERLAPEWLLTGEKAPPPGVPLWPGPWRWCFWGVETPQRALELGQRGATLVESDEISALISHPYWRKG